LTRDAVSEENWIGDSDETVVDAVSVEVRDVARGEIGEDCSRGIGGGEGRTKGGVESSISIGSNGD